MVIEKLEGLTSKEAEKTLIEMETEQPLPRETARPVSATFTQVKMNVSDATLKLMEDSKNMLG